MGNAKAADKLRRKLAGEEAEQTQEALAASAEGKEATVAVEKLQDELENTKLVLAETKAEKEALQDELDAAKSTEAEHTALLTKRADEIAALQSNMETFKAECEEDAGKATETLESKVTSLTAEVAKLKKELAAAKKK